MPAIDVYKANGAMIPIAEAKTARAYQCPWTKQLYATKKTYVKHLKELRTTRMHSRAKQNRWLKLGKDLWNQSSFEDIISWVEMHPEWFLDNAQRRGFASDRSKYDRIRPEFSIKLTYLDVTWRGSVSNTHDCPHNGVTNWGGRDDGTPRGYPGWLGRIEYQTSHNLPGFGSAVMDGTRIHTGTGGGISNNRYGHSVTFFDDDWPGLAERFRLEEEQYDKDNLFEVLKNKSKPYEKPRFEYGTPYYFKF
jgi:hypothetical protein